MQYREQNNKVNNIKSSLYAQIIPISYSRDGVIRVWDAAHTFAAGSELNMHPNAPHFCNIATDPQGSSTCTSILVSLDLDPYTIVSPSEEESKIHIYDVRSGPSLIATHDTASFSAKLGTVTSLHYDSRENLIIAGCENGSISAVDVKTGRYSRN